MGTKRRAVNAPSLATPARKAAFDALVAVRKQKAYLVNVAERAFSPYALDAPDKAFARLLAHGALSLQATLDLLIDRTLRSPRDIEPDVRDALRIAAYEIIYLHKEDHAAVDQGVELVRFCAPRASGVANYVLHRIVEEKERFPYGDPQDSLETAALFYGFPDWLARTIKKDIGTRNALAFMEDSLGAAPVYFAVNGCVATREEIVRTLEDAGIEYATHRPLSHEGSTASDSVFQLVQRRDVGSTAFMTLLSAEKIIVSDRSAQSIARRSVSILPQEDARILEIGAGRGTKTVLLQSFCKEHGITLGRYDALDISKKKLAGLEVRVEQAGGSLSSTLATDATKPFAFPDSAYHLVFVDAPCTGIGTLRRHPEIKARLDEDDSRTLAKMGQAMLAQGAGKVAPGGHLLYATCTILKEENEKTIKRFLASPEGARFEVVVIGEGGAPFFKTPITPNGPDLHFAALLRCVRGS